MDGIARSGLWLDKGKPHREDAADFVGRFYYNQKPALLRWALTKPHGPRHVQPARAAQGGLRPGARSDDRDRRLNKKIEFSEYTDTRFSDQASIQTPWRYEPGIAVASKEKTHMFRRRFLQLITFAGVGSLAALTPWRRKKTVIYRVKGFSCITCAMGLDMMLGRHKGVVGQIHLSGGERTVGFDPQQITEKPRRVHHGSGLTVTERLRIPPQKLLAIGRDSCRTLDLRQPPVAICFTDSMPPGVASHAGRVPAGCRFWEDAASTAFATSASDHSLCAIGVYTHNLQTSPAHQIDLMDALKVFGELGYVREEDLASIPVLGSQPAYVVYSPGDSPLPPDVVLLFVNANQTLILSEATQQVENQNAPAMGRPACAVVPQVMNTGRAALSLGCCGARAYLDVLTEDVAIFAIPGANSRLTHGGSRPWPVRMLC